jgi:hypothetical protein
MFAATSSFLSAFTFSRKIAMLLSAVLLAEAVVLAGALVAVAGAGAFV